MPPRASQQEEGYFFLAHFNFVLFTVDFIAVIIYVQSRLLDIPANCSPSRSGEGGASGVRPFRWIREMIPRARTP